MSATNIRFSLNAKTALWGASVVAVTAAALLALAFWQSGQYNRLAQAEVDGLLDADLDHITQGVYSLLETEQAAVREQLHTNLNVARRLLESAGGLQAAPATVPWTAIDQTTKERREMRLPAVRVGGQVLTQDPIPGRETPVVDELVRLVGGTATIFQRMNPEGDMIRVATNVETIEGERAVGTYIPAREGDGTPNPVIASVLSAGSYGGRAYVVDFWSLTSYEPIRDSAAEVIGMLYVGVRLETVEARVRRTVQETAIGKSGYVFALRATGADRGQYLVSQRGERNGENVWDTRDSDGNYVIRDIIAKALPLAKGGLATHRYRWRNPGEPEPRWKVARLAYFPDWDWVIGTSAYEDELLPYREILDAGRRRMTAIMGFAGLGITLLIGLLGVFAAWSLVRPLREMTTAVGSVDGGSLARKVEARSGDEIGALARTFNAMTERLRSTLEGLRVSEEKYRGIFENSVEGLCRTTMDGRFLNANPAMARKLGYGSPEELVRQVQDIGRDLYADPRDRADLEARLLADGQVIEREVRFRRRDGGLLWVSIDMRLARDATGRPLYVDSFLRDVTEHRAADEALRKANERFRSVLRASVGYSIIGTDPEGRIRIFNEGAERMLGYGAEEVLDRTTVLALHDAGEVAARAAELGVEPGFEVFAAPTRGGAIETREWTYVRKDGSRLTVSLSVTALRGETGELSGFIGIARDVTAEKRMEEQLLQSRKMESVGLLAGGVAHDFNNLLTPILGYADMLLEDLPAADPRAAPLEEMRKAAERARDLTQRLLAFSRKQLIQLATVDLGEVIRRFQEMLRRTIREDIRIEIRIPASLSPVRADPGQIEQVLLNLAINAQDAMPGGGLLAIAAEDIDLDDSFSSRHLETAPGPYVLLQVSDNGTGMDKATLDHLFEPFFTTKELGRGTGLGLSTVYGIVKEHGGSLSVYSEKGMGSTFKIYLPRAAPRPADRENAEGREKGGARGTETILVAEDNEMVRRLSCRMLGSLGYRVIEADGVDRCTALMRERTEPVDLLLTDVVMPKCNGRDLYEMLRRRQPGLKVLYMSGYASQVIGGQGILEEGMQFIQKPFSLPLLARKIRQVLDAR